MSENTPVMNPDLSVSFSGTTFSDAEFVTKSVEAPQKLEDKPNSSTTDVVTPEIVDPQIDGKASEMSEADKQLVKDIKKLKAKMGEEEFEVAAEAMFKHKVDGQEMDVSLQDLLNNFSGKTAWDKRFTELDKERKSHKNEVERINQYVNSFADMVKNNDYMGALSYLGQFVGKDPIEFRKEARAQLLTQMEKYITMSPEERQFVEQQEEIDLLRQERQSASARNQEAQSIQERDLAFQQIQETYGISDERAEECIRDLMKSDTNPNGIEADLITGEDIAAYHQADKAVKRVEQLLVHVNPDLVNDDDIVELLVKKVMKNQNIDDDTLLAPIRKLSPKHNADIEALAEKVSENKPKIGTPSSQPSEVRNAKNALFFSDLDF